MIANFDNLKNIPDANKKMIELIQNHWKIFHFYIGGGDAEEGYVIVKDESEIEALVSHEDSGLLYGPRWGIKHYTITQIKVKKKFLNTVCLKQPKKEKMAEFDKIKFIRQERDKFYFDDNNTNRFTRAEVFISCFENKPILYRIS